MDESISYTFNPAVRLRVLVFYGLRAGELSTEVEGVLPTLGLPELRELLQSTNERQLLLGILAARELKSFTVLDLLEPLRSHPETIIARAARKTHEELLQFAIEIGGERLREEKKRHPERSASVSAHGRCAPAASNAARLIRDRRQTNEHITSILRTALTDHDWEVRTTAMLAACRLKVRELGGDIRNLELPKTSRHGPDETDRSILFAARKIVLDFLAHDCADAPPPNPTARMDDEPPVAGRRYSPTFAPMCAGPVDKPLGSHFPVDERTDGAFRGGESSSARVASHRFPGWHFPAPALQARTLLDSLRAALAWHGRAGRSSPEPSTSCNSQPRLLPVDSSVM